MAGVAALVEEVVVEPEGVEGALVGGLGGLGDGVPRVAGRAGRVRVELETELHRLASSVGRGAWDVGRGPWAVDENNPANDCGPAGPTTGCGHLIVGTTKVWETITGTADDFNGPTWYINSPDLVKGALADRSYINQLAFEPAQQSTVIVGTNDGNVQIGFGMGTGAANSATWVNVTGSNAVRVRA